MCDPATVAVLSFGIGAAQSVMSYQAQAADSKAAQKAAVQANVDDQNSLTLRQLQEQDALADKNRGLNIEEAQKVADADNSAAASGVSGISVDSILSDVSRQAAYARETNRTNNRNIVAQLSQEKKAAANKAKGRINASPAPNPLSLVAGIGGAAVSSYSNYNSLKVS